MFIETCKCPQVVSANYYRLEPFINQLSNGKLIGLFPDIIGDMISFACGKCSRRSKVNETTVDLVRDGRLNFAEKSNEAKLLAAVDEYTDISYPVIGYKAATTMLGAHFCSKDFRFSLSLFVCCSFFFVVGFFFNFTVLIKTEEEFVNHSS